MALDITARAQRKIWGNLFADASVSLGGGGGGKSVQQSIELSGTGGFARSSVGLGYDFSDFAVGVNVARMKFKQSTIASTHLSATLQVPFSYVVGSYASSGSTVSAAQSRGFFDDSAETTLTLGLAGVAQIKPQASYKNSFQVADFQFAHFMTPNAYWYASAALGYQGLPLYNHLLGGVGYRLSVAPKVNLHAQIGVGSGGYAPEKIDTGAGLLVYPKVSAEVDIAKNFSLSLAAGYLFAPNASSKNYSVGAALSYHIQPSRSGVGASGASNDLSLKGYRFSLFQQTAYNVSYRGIDRPKISLLSLQLDNLLSPHVYIPVQLSAAYVAYLGYPGYGEILAGVGVQTENRKDQPLQWFGQLMAGANVHGPVVKADIGMNYALSDQLAVRASVGQTRGPSSGGKNFKTDELGLGMTYRFSVPGW